MELNWSEANPKIDFTATVPQMNALKNGMIITNKNYYNMEFNTLQNIPVEKLYQVFIDAFSNYSVKQEISLQQFTEMITTRSFSPEDSIGCFCDDQLVGFILTGIRVYSSEKQGYDIATGVLNEHQNKGIGKEMIAKLVDLLKANSVNNFKLEVLEGNEAAINLYKNSGFAITRKLECYEAEKEQLVFPESLRFYFKNDLSKFARISTSSYELFKPTWQNDLVTIGNFIDKHSYQAIERNGNIVCFGFINRESGRIPLIGVLPEWRNQGLEAALISKLATFSKSEKISFINVETNSYLSETLDNLGILTTISQYEMKLDLRG